jgi:hypothetical protein
MQLTGCTSQLQVPLDPAHPASSVCQTMALLPPSLLLLLLEEMQNGKCRGVVLRSCSCCVSPRKLYLLSCLCKLLIDDVNLRQAQHRRSQPVRRPACNCKQWTDICGCAAFTGDACSFADTAGASTAKQMCHRCSAPVGINNCLKSLLTVTAAAGQHAAVVAE